MRVQLSHLRCGDMWEFLVMSKLVPHSALMFAQTTCDPNWTRAASDLHVDIILQLRRCTGNHIVSLVYLWKWLHFSNLIHFTIDSGLLVDSNNNVFIFTSQLTILQNININSPYLYNIFTIHIIPPKERLCSVTPRLSVVCGIREAADVVGFHPGDYKIYQLSHIECFKPVKDLLLHHFYGTLNIIVGVMPSS